MLLSDQIPMVDILLSLILINIDIIDNDSNDIMYMEQLKKERNLVLDKDE